MNHFHKKSIVSFFVVMMLSAGAATAFAHCQVPCGIYDDYARVHAMAEDVTTVKKSMTLINELAGKSDAQSQNQLVRWINTKEMHAQKIIATISDYFLTQRVNANQEDYVERLKAHHAVIVEAMKAKQNTKVEGVDALEKAVNALVKYYPHQH